MIVHELSTDPNDPLRIEITDDFEHIAIMTSAECIMMTWAELEGIMALRRGRSLGEVIASTTPVVEGRTNLHEPDNTTQPWCE